MKKKNRNRKASFREIVFELMLTLNSSAIFLFVRKIRPKNGKREIIDRILL